mgnify:CR=1 FL=1
MPESKYANILHGIGGDYDEPSDYVWQNYLVSDYHYMMYNGFGNMNPMINQTYYPQSEPMYNNMANGHFNMNYNVVYNNYNPMPYLETNQKNKKYDMFMGKAKS